MVINSEYMQLIKNLEYLKLKQMVNHLDEFIDFSIKNSLSNSQGCRISSY